MSWTLVLNSNWTAITATTVFRALTLMFRGSAVAVCPETYETYNIDQWIERSRNKLLDVSNAIRTVSLSIEKPEIILVKTYGGIPHAEINFTRRNLYKRDKNQCQYCGRRQAAHKLTIDHVFPRSKGGVTSYENCVAACEPCNNKKADRTLRESGMKLIKRPTKPKWNPVMGFIPKNYPTSWNTFIRKRK